MTGQAREEEEHQSNGVKVSLLCQKTTPLQVKVL